MKIRYFLLGIFLMLSAADLSWATVIGAPISKGQPSKFSLESTFSMWKKEFDSKDLNDSGDLTGNRFFITPAYGIHTNADAFLRVGLVNAKIEYPEGDVKTDFEFSYGAGTKITILTNGRLSIGMVLQFLVWEGDDSVGNYSVDLDFIEVDLAAGANYKINSMFSCYGGLMFSKSDADLYSSYQDSYTDHLNEESLIGFFMGGNYSFLANAFAGMEIKLLAEKTLIAITGGYIF